MLAEFAVNKSDLVPLHDDYYAAIVGFDAPLLHQNALGEYADPLEGWVRYLSVQPNGDLETREVVRSWETARLAGNRLVYSVGGVIWDVLVNTEL